MNSITISGHLGRDPLLKETQKGNVCEFALAHSQGKDKEPMWLYVSTWGSTAEYCNMNLKKGNKVTVIGRLKQSKYINSKGEQKEPLTITAQQVELQGKKETSTDTESAISQDYTLETDSTFTSDDIPF